MIRNYQVRIRSSLPEKMLRLMAVADMLGTLLMVAPEAADELSGLPRVHKRLLELGDYFAKDSDFTKFPQLFGAVLELLLLSSEDGIELPSWVKVVLTTDSIRDSAIRLGSDASWWFIRHTPYDGVPPNPDKILQMQSHVMDGVLYCLAKGNVDHDETLKISAALSTLNQTIHAQFKGGKEPFLKNSFRSFGALVLNVLVASAFLYDAGIDEDIGVCSLEPSQN